MEKKNKPYEHVEYLWDEEVAQSLDPVERLRYRSNILGNDQRVTNTGGGNTSSKIMEIDPLSGEAVEVLWVKGSGGDLRTSTRENFASLYLDKLKALQPLYNASEKRGVKTEIEDAMVGMYRHCTFNLNPRASSIDTPLHAFVSGKHVDHTHPNAVIAVAACKDQEQLTKEIYGDDVIWTAWQRPGFDLGMIYEAVSEEVPRAKGIMMGQHGLINWADDDKACYELTLELIEKAAKYIAAHDQDQQTFGGQKYHPLQDEERNALLVELLPHIRRMISQQVRFIGTVQTNETILRFVNSHDAARLAELGTSCPDHFLRTKIKPLYVAWDPQEENVTALFEKLEEGVKQYRSDYVAYYEACKQPDSPPMRDPNPRVILIPGVGMVAWGKNKSESRVTAEFYMNAVEVMRGAEAISEYIALPRQEAFDIEYWPLEEAKLRRMPPDKELAHNVVIVVGAGSGIGKAVALRVAKEGAHVVCADLDEASAAGTADELTAIYGQGIGVAGSGISSCGPAIGLGVDITDRDSVREMFAQVLLAYGGIDNIVITAGLFVSPDEQGKIPDDGWAKTFAINVTGGYIVADEAARIWRAQMLPGTLVLTTSVNAVVAKRGSFAYDASKAAANHLVRELAIELAPLVRVNGLAPATVVDGSNMFPRDRVVSSLIKYDIDFESDEDADALREKLANFYAQRNLTKSNIGLVDQAEIAFLLSSRQFGKTTGQIINVDGGLHEAFLR